MKLERLGGVIKIISGSPFDSKFFNENKEGMPLIRVRDVNSGFAGIYYSGKYEDTFLINNGDLLIGLDGDFKCVEWKFGIALLNQRVCKIIPIEGLASRDYILHFLPQALNEIHRNTNFTTVKHLSTKTINEIKIPLPSLLDQIRIAEMLSQAESLIVQRKKSILLLDELLKSTFWDMFGNPVKNEKGWEIKPFSKVAKNENSKRVAVKQSDRDKREGEYPYYGATGIIDTIDEYRFDGTYLLIAEDGKNLLFRKKNNAFMASGKFWVNNHAHVLSFNGVGNLRYVEFFLNNIDFSPYISGIDQVKLNKESLERIPVPLPPIELQIRFSTIVVKVENLKAQYQQSLTELQSMYGVLSQKAFKGELNIKEVRIKEKV